MNPPVVKEIKEDIELEELEDSKEEKVSTLLLVANVE